MECANNFVKKEHFVGKILEKKCIFGAKEMIFYAKVTIFICIFNKKAVPLREILIS